MTIDGGRVRRAARALVFLALSLAPAVARAGGESMGINPNDLVDLNKARAAADRIRDAGAKWVRLEIKRERDINHWNAVVNEFRARGIEVLGLLDHQTWAGPARDPDACGYSPTAFGSRLINEWIPAAQPYFNALQDRVRYWEIWNEANNSPTWVCPGNYAYLLVELRLRWGGTGVQLGPSLTSQASAPGARDYLNTLYTNTEKTIWYRNTYGDAPWHKVMHHPYPGGELPETFIPNQANMLKAVQPKPLWFTEIGWFADDLAFQADMLRRAFRTALPSRAERMFWFALYDCSGEPFGLIAGCNADGSGTLRPSYDAFKAEAGGATPPPPPPPSGPGTGLRGQYFDNIDFTAPFTTRAEAINFDWGAGAPVAGMGADTFSVVWNGYLIPRYSQSYTICTVSDDGVQVRLGAAVGSTLIINNWTDHAPTENCGTTPVLQAGQPQRFSVSYYERGGGALLRLYWQSASQPKEIIPATQLRPTGLKGDYYDNRDFTAFKFSRTDAVVGFNWGNGSPDASIAADTFSARWTGSVRPPASGLWTFCTTSDDGVRLWVNNLLLIDNWTDHGATENCGSANLSGATEYPVRLDYYENGGGALISLSWSGPTRAKEVIPSIYLWPIAGLP